VQVATIQEFWTGSSWARIPMLHKIVKHRILTITKIQDGRAHELPVQNSGIVATRAHVACIGYFIKTCIFLNMSTQTYGHADGNAS